MLLQPVLLVLPSPALACAGVSSCSKELVGWVSWPVLASLPGFLEHAVPVVWESEAFEGLALDLGVEALWL